MRVRTGVHAEPATHGQCSRSHPCACCVRRMLGNSRGALASKLSGYSRAMSRVCVPMDPVEPRSARCLREALASSIRRIVSRTSASPSTGAAHAPRTWMQHACELLKNRHR
eukprot:6198409-Pleurochrysis_carterae.AAC.3